MIGLVIELIEWTIKLMVITAVIMFLMLWFMIIGTMWLVAAAIAAKNHRLLPQFPTMPRVRLHRLL